MKQCIWRHGWWVGGSCQSAKSFCKRHNMGFLYPINHHPCSYPPITPKYFSSPHTTCAYPAKPCNHHHKVVLMISVKHFLMKVISPHSLLVMIVKHLLGHCLAWLLLSLYCLAGSLLDQVLSVFRSNMHYPLLSSSVLRQHCPLLLLQIFLY